MLDRTVSAVVDRGPTRDGGPFDRDRQTCGSRMTGPRWHCAAARSQQEHRALSELLTQGFEAYLPLHLDRPRGRPERIVPLFVGYLFVRFDAFADPWGPIRS